jgi:hypothetical protein
MNIFSETEFIKSLCFDRQYIRYGWQAFDLTDSDVYFFSFFGSLLSPPYCHLSRRSYWYQLISSSLCSFIYIKHTPWSVSHPLYRHHIVLL